MYVMNKTLKSEISSFLSDVANRLIENNPEDYETGYTDYGYYHNGVGFACCGKEMTYNEDKAYEDAKEKLVEDIEIYSGKKKGFANGYLDELLEKVPSLTKTLTTIIERA